MHSEFRIESRVLRLSLIAPLALIATACGGGGGGGGGGSSAPAKPTVTLTASPTAIATGQSSTLTWSSTGATSCTASGAWSGSEATSGSTSTGALAAAATYTLSCTGSGGTTQTSASVAVPPNLVALSVDPGPASIVNTLFTTVTICVPGTQTCQTIDHIQVDTGSSGLRILSSILLPSMKLTTQQAPDKNSLAECVQFVVGYSWGPIATVDLTVGGETAANVPVHVIGDPTFNVPQPCAQIPNPLNTVAQFGAKGIIGVSFANEDCGSGCVSPGLGFYYSCTSATACTEIAMPLANQLPNPVRLFATDNNGVIIQLPSVPSAGASTLAGTMAFGIDTQSDNQSSSTQKVLLLDGAGDFTTIYNKQSLTASFADTGSSGLYFNDSSIATCPASSAFSGFYCPASTLNLSATLQGTNAVASAQSFSVADPETLSGNHPDYAVFGNLGAPFSASSNVFDWGLPFYFGKTVYTVIEGRATSAGTGPYIAF
jgi:hypothetical protein